MTEPESGEKRICSVLPENPRDKAGVGEGFRRKEMNVTNIYLSLESLGFLINI